jgi:ribonuclease HI
MQLQWRFYIKVFYQSKRRKSVGFWWVPGHTDMPHNEVAFVAAREAVMHGVCQLNELDAVMFALVFFRLVLFKARQVDPYR